MSTEMTDSTRIIEKMKEDIAHLKELQAHAESKWIVCSERHVYVGDGMGLNDTGFAVRYVGHPHYPEFETKEEAQRYIDPFLVDKDNRPIFTYPKLALEFYDEEIREIEATLNYFFGSELKSQE